MPMVYTSSLAAAGNSTTNGTINTETDHYDILPGSSRSVYWQAMYVIGKGGGLTTISGLAFRMVKFTTGSTVGTTVTPAPKDGGMAAASITVKSLPTVGSTRTQHVIFGCGAAGPGGYVAPNPDSMIVLNAATTATLDCLSSCGTISLNFEWSFEHQE